MNKKQELNSRLLYFCPEIIFDGTTGGVKLVMGIDALNGQINWTVYEGDHRKDFQSFEEACEYYINIMGEK